VPEQKLRLVVMRSPLSEPDLFDGAKLQIGDIAAKQTARPQDSTTSAPPAASLRPTHMTPSTDTFATIWLRR